MTLWIVMLGTPWKPSDAFGFVSVWEKGTKKFNSLHGTRHANICPCSSKGFHPIGPVRTDLWSKLALSAALNYCSKGFLRR